MFHFLIHYIYCRLGSAIDIGLHSFFKPLFPAKNEKYMTQLLEKPIPPEDDDCCGGGACNPCVWDHYNAELQKWRIEQAKLREQKKNEVQ